MSTAEPPDGPGPPEPVPVPDSPPVTDAADLADATDAPPSGATEPTAATGATWSAATSGVIAPPAVPAPPEPWTAPAPPPKRRLTWLWILIGVLVLIAALVVVAVVLFLRTINGPIDATSDVLAQIKAGHYAEARRLSCSADRDRFNDRQYARLLGDIVAERGAVTSYDVNYGKVDGDRAEVRYDIEFRRDGHERYGAVAVKEGGNWRPCLFTRPDG